MADIQATTNERQTSLHAASSEGRVQMAEFLLDHGCDMEAKDADGHTPLRTACESNNFQVAALLADRGANAHDNEWTVFDLAEQHGTLDLLFSAIRQNPWLCQK
ncbi:unnamed protein product [Cylindrotheca closterium]|uniref:Uncharacterized protein n=1 Tax=Cylindrotheca closterium TaxID=2856 RepID=A0AAD2CGL1_9STRA|nr:unnamed protein product [Cylindrotheca closterium]